MRITRRSILQRGVGAGTIGMCALAGCISDVETRTEYTSGYAAFFPLWDWATQVGGDIVSFENVVDTGEMGHGWEPEGNIVATIARSNVFVYLDTPEFSWAQDVAAMLTADYEGITVIDGMDGLDHHFLDGIPHRDHDHDHDNGHDHDNDHNHDHDHNNDHPTEVATVEIIDRSTNEIVADVHGDHWHGGIPTIPLHEHVSLGATFLDPDGQELRIGSDEPFQFDARPTDDAADDVVDIESHGDHVHLIGTTLGSVDIVFQLIHDGHEDWAAPPIRAQVVANDTGETRGFIDPHVWVDPIIAKDIVDTIADGLAAVDTDNAAIFRENAAAYTADLTTVDTQFRELVEHAERDVAVLAGHNSFQYIAHRYGFTFHSPQGVSPNDSPSPGDIADTIEVVNDLGVPTILYDYFEAPSGDIPQLAATILENSDATDAAPLTPVEGTTHEWNDKGWGWIDQMTNINLPSLERALL